jgi:hypothetical protein
MNDQNIMSSKGRGDCVDSILDNIDRVAAIDHVLSSMVSAHVELHPFPYVFLKNVFDKNTYDVLLHLVRVDDLFQVENGGTGYTIFRYPQLNHDLSPKIHAFIDFMAQELTPALFDALRSKFSDSLLQWANCLRERGIYIKPADAILATELQTELHPYQHIHSLHDGMTSQFEIMRRTQEFAISPHCHPVRELLIGIFPITADDSLEDYGTDLFEIKAGCSLDMDTNEFSYVPRDILNFAGRTKFLRNSAFVMLNSAGVHAYTPPSMPRARDYLYTTLLIGTNALASPKG